MPPPEPPPTGVPFGLGTSLVLLAVGLALFAYIIGRLLAEEHAKDETPSEPESSEGDPGSTSDEPTANDKSSEHSDDAVV